MHWPSLAMRDAVTRLHRLLHAHITVPLHRVLDWSLRGRGKFIRETCGAESPNASLFRLLSYPPPPMPPPCCSPGLEDGKGGGPSGTDGAGTVEDAESQAEVPLGVDVDLGVGVGAHTDFELFTIMHQSAPGLEFVDSKDGNWVEAHSGNPVRLLIIVGDTLEHVSNGFYRATRHRVRATPIGAQRRRNSLVLFEAFDDDTLLGPAQPPAPVLPLIKRGGHTEEVSGFVKWLWKVTADCGDGGGRADDDRGRGWLVGLELDADACGTRSSRPEGKGGGTTSQWPSASKPLTQREWINLREKHPLGGGGV